MKRLLAFTILVLLFVYSAKAESDKPAFVPTKSEAEILERWQYEHEYLLIIEGDTWYNLGKKLNCDYELLKAFNQKKSLNVQDVIMIPGGKNLNHAYQLDDEFFIRVNETLELLYYDNLHHMPKD